MIKDSKNNPVSIMTNHIQANSNSGLTPISPTRTNRLRTALRRIAASAALLLGLALPAVADDYVIMYSGGYLAVSDGAVTYTTTFSPSCVWTCVSSTSTLESAALNGDTPYFLYTVENGNRYWMVGSTTNGAAISVTTTAPGTAGWRAYNSRIRWQTGQTTYYVYYRGSQWRTSSTGRSRDNNGYQANNGNPDYRAAPTAVTTTSTEASTTVTVPTISPTSTELDLNDSQAFTASATATTAPAYTSYEFTVSSTDYSYYYLNGTRYDSESAMKSSSAWRSATAAPTVTYSWTLSGSANSYLSPTSGTGASITIKHLSQAPANTNSTLSVTASATANGKTGSNTSTSNATITANAPKIDPTGISAASPVTVYVGNTGAVTYTLTPSGAYDNVTGTSSNPSIFTVGTVSGGTAVINPVAVGTAKLTLTAHEIDSDPLSPVEVTINVKNKVATPTFQFQQIGETETANATIQCATAGATIHYKLNNGSYTEYTNNTTIVVNSDQDRLYAYAVMEGNSYWDDSEIYDEVWVSCQTAAPTISYTTANQKATVTITALTGATIYYTTDGSQPNSNSLHNENTVTLTNQTNGTIIRAYAKDPTCKSSAIVSDTLVVTGVSEGGIITLDDREDHNLSYYQPSDSLPTGYPESLHSPFPRNFQIKYWGYGDNTYSTSETASPAKNTFTNNTATGDVKVGIDAPGNVFLYYKTLERDDNNRFPYELIPNPFTVRPKKSDVYYGFYKWRVKSITGGSIYAASSGGTALATTSTTSSDNVFLDAETTYYFQPTDNQLKNANNATSMTIELEALWAPAEVSTSGSFSKGYNSVERNFYIVSTGTTSNMPAVSTPCTYTSFYPNGTTNGTIAATLQNRNTRRGGFSSTGDSKIEYMILTNYSSTINANMKNLIIGRGVSPSSTYCANIVEGTTSTSGTFGATTYTIRLESGVYVSLNLTGVTSSNTNQIKFSSTLNVKCVLGSDYDRAVGDNDKLSISPTGSSGTIYGGQGLRFNGSDNINNITFDWYVKSGKFHSGILGSADGGDQSIYIGSSHYEGTSYDIRYFGRRRITIEGGDIASVAGGVDDTSNSNVSPNDGGWTTMIRVKGGTIRGSVYGAAAYSGAKGDRAFIFTGGTVGGWIAGGANGTQSDGGLLTGSSFIYVGGKTSVDSKSATSVINRAVGGNVFGAGCGYGSSSSSGQVSAGTNVVIADKAYIERGVYGGGSYGYTTSTANLYILGGTIDGKSGGVSGTSYSASITGGVYGGACQNKGGTVNITMTGGEVHTGFYGGSNATGTVSGNVTMHIDGGQVGTSSTTANVHGGGYGTSTAVNGNVDLFIGTANGNGTYSGDATIYGDVYGGSADGSVNDATNDYTHVTLNSGTIYGSLYGGGLGITNSNCNVNGAVEVIVNGGSVKKQATGDNPASIFGCNNAMGTPKSTVIVTINSTSPSVIENGVKQYAINGVYGGGNQAHYIPSSIAKGYPLVTINGCASSIKDVYGGGRAAGVSQTKVVINGGDIDRAFAGGDGDNPNNTPAHIGYHNKTLNSTSDGYDTPTNNNGVGDANIFIYGGTVNQVFGGSNKNGTIRDDINVTVEKNGECDDSLHVGSLYGGGNMAASQVGNIIIGCMREKDIIDSLFCGANQATVNGSINFTMEKGRIGNLFGGNNVTGAPSGSITVTVNWITSGNNACTSDYNNYLGNVFGGGNLATFGTENNKKAPTVKILNGTVSGNVYGGGKGLASDHSKGLITGNPQVTIGDANNQNNDNVKAIVKGAVFGGGDAGNVNGTPEVNVIEKCNTEIGFVYGGGNAADVIGTNVTINGGTIGDVFGGGNGAVAAANVTGSTGLTIHGGTITRVFAGGNTAGTIGNNTGVTIDHTSSCDQYIAEVYGGGNLAEGAAGTVTIECSADSIGDVYGGANQANITTDITLNITGGKINNVFGGNNTSGAIKGAITVNIEKDPNCNTFSVNNVYGGGNLAQYSIFGYDGNDSIKTSGNTLYANPSVNILNGTVSKNVYGGGKGKLKDGNERGVAGKVIGDPQVTIGDDVNNHTATILGDVYGGGDAADVAGTPVIVVNDCNTQIGYLYGGGNAADVDSASITINGGTITYDAFGGGHGDKNASNPSKYADVNGGVTFLVKGGTIGRVFAGSNSRGEIKGTSNLTINKIGNCDMKIGEVYGGGNEAAGVASSLNIGCTGSWTTGDANNKDHAHADTINNRIGYELEGIGSVYGGANQANIGTSEDHSNIEVNINSGIIANVFGGNNTSGTIYGTITVNIEKDENATCASDWYVGNVFGGGNLAQYSGAPAVNILNGTVSGNVYGGGKGLVSDHTKGQVTGNPVVTIGDNTQAHSDYVAAVTGDVYGGGDAGNVVGIPVVNVISKQNTTIGNVYGGGNAADVNGTDVNIDGGTITGMVFGGGHGDKNSNPQKQADVNGDVAVDITGGTINKVFGGSNSKGNITGTVAVNIAKGANSCDMFIGEVYGGGNEAAGNAGSVNIGCTGEWTTGDANNKDHAHADTINNRIGYELEGIGAVYGGANAADIGSSESSSNITLNINSGMVAKVYGGNNTSGTIYGTIQVNINKNAQTCGWYVGDVFGGGNQAVYTAPNGSQNYPQVNILNGTVSGDVFGGGYGNASDATKGVVNGNPQVIINGANVTVAGGIYGGGSLAPTGGNPVITLTNGATTNIYGGGKAANVNGAPTVNINGGTVSTGVFGGCDSIGTISGAIAVNINGGTIGTNGTHAYGIFGGGKGSATRTGDAVTVIVGDSANLSPIIYGDVYGGSAEGQVNDAVAEITKVWLKKGTINGSLYGGGFGDNGSNALVNGSVWVVVDGGTVTGSIFGCNNANGTPKGTVTVDINGSAATQLDDQNNKVYALQGVYGGGNLAHYDPTDDTNHPTVTISGCETSVKAVYGGGNAAAVPSTYVVINGGDIYQVFAGGNGQSGAANVGYKNKNTNPTTDSYGSGTANALIKGGTIKEVYGGSNTNGAIRASGKLEIARASGDGTCNLKITDLYGGGNRAAGAASEISIACTGTNDDEGITNVYGGANAAAVNGDISLTIKEGRIANVYGGNNSTGEISGTITVNIDQKDNPCVWSIGNVYGGGKDAAYPNHQGTDYPQVNIKKGTVSGNVFGGGYGSDARVTANPHVYLTGGSVSGNVFGGGEAAPVTGNPAIIASGTAQAKKLYGGGLGTTAVVDGNSTVNVSGGTYNYVFGGGEAADLKGSATINISDSAIIVYDVYGGGALANTNIGNATHYGESDESVTTTSTNTTTVNLTGGTVTNVYGGGLGDAENQGDGHTDVEAKVYGNVFVNLNKGVSSSSKGSIITGNIFGCNNINGTPLGSVYVHVYATQNSAVSTIENKSSQTFDVAAVYGGGNMAQYIPAHADTTHTNVIIEGCGLTTIGYVYGGGNAAPVPATKVTIFGSDTIGNVFGGGNGKDKIIINGEPTDNPGADVGIHTVTAAVYNQPANASLKYTDANYTDPNKKYLMYGDTAGTSIIGTTNVIIMGGTVGQLFGGSNTKGDIIKEAKVTLGDEDLKTCEFNVGGVYGGSNEAYMSGSASILMNCVDGMSEIYGGSKMADVSHDIVLTITGGHYNKVFGGNNLSGRVMGSITINIEQTGCLPIEIDELYGGGNQAPYSVYGYKDTYKTVVLEDGTRVTHYDLYEPGDRNQQYHDPEINIVSCKSIGKVFGGGLKALMIGSPTIYVDMVKGWTDGSYTGQKPGIEDPHSDYANTKYKFTELGSVDTIFGGGNLADVKGNTNILVGTRDEVTVHEIKKGVYTVISAGRTDITDPGFDGNDNNDVTKDLIISVEGANITGNIYGGGNHADVTGKTNIVIGKEGQEQQQQQQQPAQNPAPIRSEQPQTQQPAQQQQPATPQSNAATQSEQTRTVAPVRL